jgi:hypothetical protein
MVHPKVKPGSKANYRQHLPFCPNDPAKSILVPAAEQQGPLSFEGSRSITAKITDVAAKKLTIRKRPIRDFGASHCSSEICDASCADV